MSETLTHLTSEIYVLFFKTMEVTRYWIKVILTFMHGDWHAASDVTQAKERAVPFSQSGGGTHFYRPV